MHFLLLAAPVLAVYSCKDLSLGEKKYDLSDLDKTWTISDGYETPPTFTNLTWYFNPCRAIVQKDCPRNSQLCGIETVTDDKDRKEITQIIPIYADKMGASREVTGFDGEGLSLSYTGATWGEGPVSAVVEIQCGENTEFVEGEDSWDGEALTLRFSSPSVCATRKPPSKGDDNDNSSDGWGLFTWLFVLIAVGMASLFAATAYINYQRHGSPAVTAENFNEMIQDLPYLFRDFVRKVKETFGSSSRGYSAL